MAPARRSLTLAFGLLMGAGPALAAAPDPWTRTDTLWEAAFAAVVAMDCGQSVQIDPTGRYERNPVLPRHPDPRTVRMICLGSVAGHVIVSRVLPVPWRRRFQAATVALEVAAVSSNYFYAGLSIKF
jgi:hypothetical protein